MATRILLIEDEAQIRDNITELLTLKGFHVETAANGRQGISQALLLQPELILCDIMMPELDGYQVLDVVRGNRSLANVPFIFLTAKTDPGDMRQGMVLGADDYLTKPFTIDNLLKAIDSRLRREAVRKADLQAQVAAQRRTLASVSAHEYNTSLNGIIGLANLLLDQHQEFEEEEIMEMVEMIKTSGLRLKRSLDNIRLMDLLQHPDASSPAYRSFSQGSASIDKELVTGYVQSVAYRADRKTHCQLTVESAQLGISQENLRICLEELLDNAFKFSAADQSVRLLGRSEAAGYCISVTNAGQPFKAEDQERIAPFVQFDRQRYEQQGFGLGLSIVKKLVELNSGRLAVESPSEGVTVVSIWLNKA